MSWSWIPYNFSWNTFIPSFTPPVSIQRRFISFVLKRSLGHLVKPGQLDVEQVDAQLGKGFVEISSVELDVEAVNSHLGDIPCRLQDGSIGKISANVPWSNPLSASIGLALSGLDLTFQLADGKATSHAADNSSVVDSVTNVAESFMHDELNNQEEAILRESFHEELPGSIRFSTTTDPTVPGAIDPFVEQTPSVDSPAEGDPEGISIFARLIERLLARFNFDASSIRVNLVHPGHATYTCQIENVHYGTEETHNANTEDSPVVCHTRSLTVAGVRAFMQILRTSETSPTTSPPTPVVPDSDSEMDEEAQIMMSQSILSLPMRDQTDRPLSSALSTISSAASSMYESAISTAERAEAISSQVVPVTTEAGGPSHEELPILTFVDPITLQLTTPPPYVASHPPSGHEHDQPGPVHPSSGGKLQYKDRLKLRVSLGTIAFTASTQTIRLGLDLLNTVQTSAPAEKSTSEPTAAVATSDSSILDKLDCSLRCRAVVALLFKSDRWATSYAAIVAFHSHPLEPPLIPHGYIRIHIDSIDSTLSTPATGSASKSRVPSSLSSSASTSSKHFSPCTIADVSVLAFHSLSQFSDDARNLCSPILITDAHMLSSYILHGSPNSVEGRGMRLPTFEVFDWTVGKPFSAEAGLQPWRTRRDSISVRRDEGSENLSFQQSPKDNGSTVLPNQPKALPPSVSLVGRLPSTSACEPAVCVKVYGNGQGSKGRSSVTFRISPIRIFLDLASVAIINSVAAEIAEQSVLKVSEQKDSPNKDNHGEVHHHEITITRGEDANANATAQSHLNRFILEDWESRRAASPSPLVTDRHGGHNAMKAIDRAGVSTTQVIFKIPLLRVEMRVPPSRARSGSLVLDLHDFSVSLNPELNKTGRNARFEGELPENARSEILDWLKGAKNDDVVAISFSKGLIAYSDLGMTTAEGILSINSDETSDKGFNKATFGYRNEALDDDSTLAAYPLVLLRSGVKAQRDMDASKSNAVLVRIPAVKSAISKGVLDGLQLWADDTSQLFGDLAASGSGSLSGSASLASSKTSTSRRSGARENQDFARQSSETIIKAVVLQASIQLQVPVAETSDLRLVDLQASGIDVLTELNVESQNQMIVTLCVRSFAISEHNSGVSHQAMKTIECGSSSAPVLQLRFQSSPVPDTTAKESYMLLTASNLLVQFWSELEWISDLALFAKPPPGVFESVVPSERTCIELRLFNCAVRITPPSKPCAFLLSLEDVSVTAELSSHTTEVVAKTLGAGLSVLLIDDVQSLPVDASARPSPGLEYWKKAGYVLILHISEHDIAVRSKSATGPPDDVVIVNSISLQVHLCADTVTGAVAFSNDIQSLFKPMDDSQASTTQGKRIPHAMLQSQTASTMLRSLDEQAFKQVPEIGPVADMICDDLPSNPEYIDASFGAAAGLRELTDEDLEDDYVGTLTHEVRQSSKARQPSVSVYGGETVTMLVPSLNIVDNYYDTLSPITPDSSGLSSFIARVSNCDVQVFLYDGYDWSRTRKTIQDQIKDVKRRLAKIRQLLASGQTYDPETDDLNTTLFNSVYVGLDQDVAELEGDALAAAIDEELNDASDVASESSWQSFQKQSTVEPKKRRRPSSLNTRNLNRSRSPSIEFFIHGLSAVFDQYLPNQALISKVLVTMHDFEILDHIRTSTWSKFLTAMLKDSKGNVRETESNMVRVELQTLQPVQGQSDQEARLRVKVLPLKLHVDQDALDFLKKFFSFSDPEVMPSASKDETFFQHVEVFPVDIKLDYKPRRVDYRALREGRTIELMNFFHFDGAEMTLRHITLKGVTGWAKIGDILNDLWTPDVKANQLVDVISGVSPIRSAVNMGSGVADLVLLPIAQYKKDGRIIRGLQKGTNAFIKSTAMEALQLGARLATGTQVILEQAETVLGGQYKNSVTTEAMYVGPLPRDSEHFPPDSEVTGEEELISKYAEQPVNIKEGVHSAYRTLSQNIKSAGQTILAVPMEVYEQAGREGPARAVIRAVPIAVLKPMIGASEAVSKTLLGLRNSLEPSVHHENEVKYKHR